MQISRRVLLGIGAIPLFSLERLLACGDKLLHFRGGLRFQRAFAAARKADILIFLGRDRSVTSLRDEKFQSTLKAVGHKVTVAEDPDGLDLSLRSAKFDLVLAGIGDVPTVNDRVVAASDKPVVIPALYKPARPELKEANSRYSLLLKMPGSPARSLGVIDKAMKSRSKRVAS